MVPFVALISIEMVSRTYDHGFQIANLCLEIEIEGYRLNFCRIRQQKPSQVFTRTESIVKKTAFPRLIVEKKPEKVEVELKKTNDTRFARTFMKLVKHGCTSFRLIPYRYCFIEELAPSIRIRLGLSKSNLQKIYANESVILFVGLHSS